MISLGVFLYFFLKYNIVNILKFLHFLLAHFNIFLINSCFLSSSINAKQKFWGLPTVFTMFMIFLKYMLRWLKLEIQFPPLNIFWENIYHHGWMIQTMLASVIHFSHTLACSLCFSSVYYKTQPVLCFCDFYNILWFLEFYLEYIWILQNKCMSFLAFIASGNTPQLLLPSKRKHSFSLPFRVSFSGRTQGPLH